MTMLLAEQITGLNDRLVAAWQNSLPGIAAWHLDNRVDSAQTDPILALVA